MQRSSQSASLWTPPPEPINSTVAEMLGESAPMQLLRTQLRRIGPYFRHVLLTGETGTGKELAARVLHQWSANSPGPFVSCDVSTVNEALIHHQGSNRITPIDGDDADCLLSAAQGGTLYLAGICDMTLPAQTQLLQVLQRHERRRKRSSHVFRRETRIIASARRDLRILAASGRFRPELLFRIAMVEINLPPLRDRKDDLTLLTDNLLHKYASQCGKRPPTLSMNAMLQLQQHGWPGNIRELENVLRSAVLQTSGALIEADDLPLLKRHPDAPQLAVSPATDTLQEVINRHVVQVLQDCDGNKLRAAERLGISRSTLYRMLGASPEQDRLSR